MEQHYPMHKAKQYTPDLLFAERGNILLADNCDQLLRTDEHHEAVLFFTNFKSPSVVDYKYRNFYKANFNLINSRLSAVDWNDLFTIGDIDNNCDKFHNILNKQINLLVPFQRSKVTSYPHWYSSDLINLIKCKKRAHIIYKQTNLIEDYTEFKRLRAKCIRLSQINYKDYIDSAENNIKLNPKIFWSYVKRSRNDNDLPL